MWLEWSYNKKINSVFLYNFSASWILCPEVHSLCFNMFNWWFHPLPSITSWLSCFPLELEPQNRNLWENRFDASHTWGVIQLQLCLLSHSWHERNELPSAFWSKLIWGPNWEMEGLTGWLKHLSGRVLLWFIPAAPKTISDLHERLCQ